MTNAEQQQSERLQDELNDDNNNNNNSSKNSSNNKNQATSRTINQAGVEGSIVESEVRKQPPVRLARPLRPKLLRRQTVLANPMAVVPPPVNRAGRQVNLAAELTGVPAALQGGSLPPKRPAYLPARYELGGFRAPDGLPAATSGGAVAASASASKPNRYLWAHWPPPSSQVTGGQQGLASATTNRYSINARVHPHHHGFHHHFAAPFSSAASRVMVVNPMQIVNLSEHTKSRLIKFIEAIKKFSEKWFSHVLLLMFLAVYACLGAYVFISFEAPTEQWEKQMIIDSRQRMVNDSYSEAKSTNREQFNELFIGKLEDYERLLSRACASGMSSSSLENQWTFWGALFYSMTVFTTIGYGHLTPITFAGRVATMIYAIFGIPILLMVLADLGKLLTRIIKYAFKKFRYLFNKLLRKKRTLKTRKMISDNTTQYIGVARDAFERGYAYIQPYGKLPEALRSHSLSRRFRKRRPGADQVLELSGDDIAPAITGSDSPTLGVDQQLVEIMQPKKEAVSDVIVTPSKQTKPVSPQPGGEKPRLVQPTSADQANNHHHGHLHHTTHHANHHAGHGTRGQSLGAVQSRRRTSNAAAVLAAAQSARKSNGKSSVSRSSSSSQMVVGSTGGLERRNRSLVGQKQSSELLAPSAAAKLEQTSPQIVEAGLPGAKQPLPAGTIQDGSDKSAKIGTDMETGAEQAGENEFLAADEELVDAQGLVGTANDDDNDEEEEEEDEFDIPVSFALFLLVTYMMFGAVVFSIWEGWNFFDSLYFVFISMSTIGFGDLVPQHPKRMIGTFIYLLFGLALTSMCINVVQEKIHATFLRAKLQIGEKMGLDLEQIMADDYYNDGSIGTEGDEDDSNSVAVSQTNSSLAHTFANDSDLLEQNAADCHQMAKVANLENSSESGVKMSKSKDSLKSMGRRRPIGGGLSAHSSHNNSLRRKPSKRNQVQRQATPTGGGSLSSPSQEQVPLNVAGAIGIQALVNVLLPGQQVAGPAPQKAQFEVVQQRTEQLVGINHPVDGGSKGVCEPLKNANLATQPSTGNPDEDREQRHRKLLLLADSGRLQVNHNSVTKSLSSDSRFNQVNSKRAGTERRNNFARSADSSRRSSVSFELNQLDDLIVALSQSPSERFGPLLGVPSSGRSSCSSSPSRSLAHRRSSSMTNKLANKTNQQPGDSERQVMIEAKKKRSIVTHSSPAAALLKISPTIPANRASDSQKALSELETIRFSAV